MQLLPPHRGRPRLQLTQRFLCVLLGLSIKVNRRAKCRSNRASLTTSNNEGGPITAPPRLSLPSPTSTLTATGTIHTHRRTATPLPVRADDPSSAVEGGCSKPQASTTATTTRRATMTHLRSWATPRALRECPPPVPRGASVSSQPLPKRHRMLP